MFANLNLLQKLAGTFFVLGKFQAIITVTLIFSIGGYLAASSLVLGGAFIFFSVFFCIADVMKRRSEKSDVERKIEGLEDQLAYLKDLQEEF